MSGSLRRSGIPVLGDVPLGTHICHFFQTGRDLFDTGQQYLAAGLESNELCLWLFIDPFGKDESIEAFRRDLPQFERHLSSGALMIEPAEEWLTEHGSFNVPFFTRKWDTLLAETKERGFDCLRVGGACFPGLRWEDIRTHEKSLNDSLGVRPVIMLCCFSLESTEAAAIVDVAQTHHVAIAQRDGRWDVVETPVRRLRELESRNRQQSALVDLGLHAVRERDIDALMKEAVTIAAHTLGTGRGIIWQVRPEHNDAIQRARVGWDELPADATIPLTDGTMVKHVITSDRSAMITDLADTRFEKSWVLREYRVASIITALIRGRDRAWGVLSVHSMTPRSFDEHDLQFMESVANVLALSIERNEHELAEQREKESVRAGRERLEALSRRLLSVQEEERRRLAIELHDELGQILTAVKINLESLPMQLQHAVDSVDRAMETTRDLALDLRPAMLDDLGLAAALRWYADRFAQQTHLAMHLSVDEIPDLPPALATVCFRVVQEALTNIARHAAARNVWIDVHRTSRGLGLTIRDDGAGFDVEAARDRAAHGASLGLVGMEERVSLAGGTIDIESAPGEGTEIRAHFPVKVAHDAHSPVARG